MAYLCFFNVNNAETGPARLTPPALRLTEQEMTMTLRTRQRLFKRHGIDTVKAPPPRPA